MTDLPDNMVLHLDAQDSSTITLIDGKVAKWVCKVSGREFVQVDPAKRPVMGTLNGKQAVLFNSASETWLVSTTPFNVPQPFSVSQVVKFGSTSGSQIPFSVNGVAPAYRNTSIGSGAKFTSHPLNPQAGPFTTDPVVLTTIYNGASSKLIAPTESVVFNTASVINSTNNRIGNWNSGNQVINGPVGEIVITSDAISDQEQINYKYRVFDNWGFGTQRPVAEIRGLPPLKIEVGFGQGATKRFDEVEWTDVSTSVRLKDSVTYGLGRNDDRGGLQAQTAKFVLDNRDHRFTPQLASSPLFPNIKIRMPVRIGVGHDSAPEWLWYGYVNGWTPAIEGGVQPIINVDCVDPLSVNGDRESRGWEVEHLLATNPKHLWMLGDSDAALGVKCEVSDTRLYLREGSSYLTLGVGKLPVEDQTVLAIDYVGTGNVRSYLQPLERTQARGGAVLFNSAIQPTWTALIPFAGTQLSVRILHNQVTLHRDDLGDDYVVRNVSLWDDKWHSVGYEITEAGLWRLWIDGVAYNSAQPLFPHVPAIDYFAFATGNVNTYECQMAAFTLWDAPTNADFIAHAAICDVNQMPLEEFFEGVIMATKVGDSVIEPANHQIKAKPIAGKTLTSLLDWIANTELGSIDNHGDTWRFRSRDSLLNPTPSMVLKPEDVAESTGVEFDISSVVNAATVTFGTDGSVTRENLESQKQYRRVHDQLDTMLESQGEADLFAQWLSNSAADPTYQIDELVVDVWTKRRTLDIEALINQRPGDVISLTDLPDSLSGTSFSLQILGFTDAISATSWTRTYKTARIATDRVFVVAADTGTDWPYSTLDTDLVVAL